MNYFNHIKEYKNHYFTPLRYLEKKFIQTFINDNNQKGLGLEVGCGNGYYSKLIKDKFKNIMFYHIDSSFNMIKHNNVKNLINCDFNKLPIKNNSLDNIISLGAVEFIGSNFFNISYSILKKDGLLIFCIPKKNILGKIYKNYYQKQNIQLYFYEDMLNNINIKDNFEIIKQQSFLMNHYFILQKKY